MKIYIFTIITILGLSVIGFGQVEKQVIRWQPNSDYSDSIISDGQELKIIHSADIFISATMILQKGWLPRALITIENKKSERILVNPTDWTLNITTPKLQVLPSKEPEKLAQSLENRAK